MKRGVICDGISRDLDQGIDQVPLVGYGDVGIDGAA